MDFPRSNTHSPLSPPAQGAADSPETTAPLCADWPRSLAWLPIPLLLALIAGLWVADLRTVYESRTVMVLLNLFFTWLASLCVCFLTARAFLGSGQPGLLMFGCGSLLWGFTSLAAAAIVDRVNPTITVHNLGVLGAAVCHLLGLLWRGRLPRPGRWLAVGYAGAMMVAALIFWGATAGVTPVFFVQDRGGTPIREVVLVLSTVLFAGVGWQMISRSRRQSGAFYYWYGLGLALVATGLMGVILLSVQGGILGWTNRLTQYLGSAYLFIAALVAARETGTWTFSLSAVDEALQRYWDTAQHRRRQPLRRLLRYGVAVVAVAAGIGLRLALEARFGTGLPPYITFYPAIMVVALLAGFGPCLLAMALSVLVVGCWVMSCVGQFAIASPVDRVGLVIFAGMGLLMGMVTELHRRYRRKAAAYDREAAVREGQARLAAFAEATFEGIAQSEAGRIIDCNEQLAQMLGYSVAELQGMEIAHLIAPEDRDRVLANIQSGRASSLEHAMLCKDGTRIVVEAQGRPVSSGSARRHTAIRDITERKRREERIATLTRLYAVLSRANETIVRARDAETLFSDVCRLVAETGGFPLVWIGEVRGRQVVPVASAGSATDYLAGIQIELDGPLGLGPAGTCIRENRTVVNDDFAVNPRTVPWRPGALRFGFLASAAFPLRRAGKPVAKLSLYARHAAAFDAEQVALLESLAADLSYALDALDHEKDRKQAEQALESAKAAAEAANVAKGQFLANMSHELRTPMNAILGMIDVALPKAIDPTVQDCLQTARGLADLLLTLLNDLLDSAKIESGKLELESVPFSLRRMLDQLARVLAVRASEKGLCFCCRMPDEMPDAVVGDRMRLQQVLLNLAGNAIKFTDWGEVEISLRVLPSPSGRGVGGEGGARGVFATSNFPHSNPLRAPTEGSSGEGTVDLEFAVRDTGIGIPPSGLERLFQPFSQADASMARRFGGTGLGLAISKSLVELMGGRIWAESELGKGSTFHFTVSLPMTNELPRDFEAPVAVHAACGPQLRILLVEDNPANQKLATYILRDRGHLVEIAGDGQEAIYLTGRKRYDVVLMDVQMPGMNGLEATAAIRARDNVRGAAAGPRVPIIAMTAHAMKGDREQCLAAGMDAYLSKPINGPEVIALVEILGADSPPAAGGAVSSPPAAVQSADLSAAAVFDPQGPPQGRMAEQRLHGDKAADRARKALAVSRPVIPEVRTPETTIVPAVVFNPELALSRCCDSQDMLRDMIACFFDDVDKLLPQMRAALEVANLAEAGRKAHRMKGTLVYLGANSAEEAAHRLERLCAERRRSSRSRGSRQRAGARVPGVESRIEGAPTGGESEGRRLSLGCQTKAAAA